MVLVVDTEQRPLAPCHPARARRLLTEGKGTSVVAGMRTGNLVRAVVPASSIKMGTHVGRLAVRATGWCNIKTRAGTVQGIHIRCVRLLQRADGYTYQKGESALSPQA